MKQIILINDPTRLSSINDIIHDNWFDKNDIYFDQNTSILRIKFRRKCIERKKIIGRNWLFKKYKIPTVEFVLQFNNVEQYNIKDTGKAEKWDIFNRIDYISQKGIIIISTCISTLIDIKIVKFEIAIKETNNIVEEGIVTSIR